MTAPKKNKKELFIKLDRAVLDWKERPAPELLQTIREAIFELYLAHYPNESTDKQHQSVLELLVELMTETLQNSPETQLESSLAKFDPNRNRNFFNYFLSLVYMRRRSPVDTAVSLDSPLNPYETGSADFHNLNADTGSSLVHSTVTFYQQEMFRLIIRCINQIGNNTYRKLIAWILFFEREPDRKKLADMLDISPSGFNSVLGRAMEQFILLLRKEIQQDWKMDDREIAMLVQVLDQGMDTDIVPELLSLLPQQLQKTALDWLNDPELQLPQQELNTLKKTVLNSMPAVISKLNRNYPDIVFREATPEYGEDSGEGANTMDYYQALTARLGGIKPAALLRSGGEANTIGTGGLILTLLGQLFPTPEQERLRRTVDRASRLSNPALEKMAEELKINLPTLASALNRPDDHRDLVKKIAGLLPHEQNRSR